MLGDLDAMNEYMNQVTLETFSSLIPESVLRGKRSRNAFTTALFWG